MTLYFTKMFKYFDSVLMERFKIFNPHLRFMLTLLLVAITFIIRLFSFTINKLVYYFALLSIYSLLYYFNYFNINIFNLAISLLLFAIPLIGEIIIVVVMITGVAEKIPHIVMLIRGIKLSIKLKSCGFPIFIGKNVHIYQPNKVAFGDHVSIYDNVVIFPGKGEVVIGNYVHIDCNSIIRGDGGVYIGNYVAIASGVRIYSISNQAKRKDQKIVEQPLIISPVIIEDDVWIGSNAVILPGVRVKRGAVIGAGAVVPMNKVLEEYTIYVGVPVRPLKKRGSRD